MVKTWKRWRDEDTETLRRLAHEGFSASVIAGEMERTTDSIFKQASRCNIELKGCGKHWQDDEIDKLRSLLGISSILEIAKELNRPVVSVYQKTRSLGMSPRNFIRGDYWTDSEIQELRASENTLTPLEVAKKLDRTVIAIRAKANRLGIELRDGRSMDWTDEEIERLRVAECTLTASEVAKDLDRTVDAVKAKARKLDIELKHGRKYIKWMV